MKSGATDARELEHRMAAGLREGAVTRVQAGIVPKVRRRPSGSAAGRSTAGRHDIETEVGGRSIRESAADAGPAGRCGHAVDLPYGGRRRPAAAAIHYRLVDGEDGGATDIGTIRNNPQKKNQGAATEAATP